MCTSCGCQKPNDDHGDRRNITLRDIDAAAEAAGTTRERVVQNIAREVQQDPTSSTTKGVRQDGYLETEGSSGYGQSESRYGEPVSENPAQQGYDPAHSGVRHAKNKPGERVATPGRETGTAWGEDQQMGYTTDTPDRQNPSR